MQFVLKPTSCRTVIVAKYYIVNFQKRPAWMLKFGNYGTTARTGIKRNSLWYLPHDYAFWWVQVTILKRILCKCWPVWNFALQIHLWQMRVLCLNFNYEHTEQQRQRQMQWQVAYASQWTLHLVLQIKDPPKHQVASQWIHLHCMILAANAVGLYSKVLHWPQFTLIIHHTKYFSMQ